jgi:glycosyltransferase involved in cell wall biosynthesis
MRVAYTMEQCWHRVPGGTAVAALETVRALRERGEIDLVGVAARHTAAPPAPFEPSIEVRHMALPRIVLYETWHYLRWPRVERATAPVDVIHATTIVVPPRSVPLVVTIHDLAFVHDPSHFTVHGLRLFRRGLRLALEEADLIVCPSDATLRDCMDAGFHQNRLAKVPMGVRATPASAEDVARVRSHYGLKRPYVIWTGTMEPRKNLGGLVKAFRLIEDEIDLVLVGPKGWNEDVEALVGPNRSGVKVLGFVPHADLGPLYAGAIVFCYPSLREGFGLPVLEAMAQGTPVVTSDRTSTAELARDAGILVDPSDPHLIAQGIRAVIEDEAVAMRLRVAGPRRAAKYSWAKTADLTARCYERVVS